MGVVRRRHGQGTRRRPRVSAATSSPTSRPVPDCRRAQRSSVRSARALGFDGTPLELAQTRTTRRARRDRRPDRDHGSVLHRRGDRGTRHADRLPRAHRRAGAGSRRHRHRRPVHRAPHAAAARPTPTVLPNAPGPKPRSVRCARRRSTRSRRSATTRSGAGHATSSTRTSESAIRRRPAPSRLLRNSVG